MTSANPYEQWQWAAVDAADPLELVVLLFEKALKSVRQAQRSLVLGDVYGRARAIQVATDCVIELVQSLDRNRQPELAGRLLQLYAYVLDRLREANFRQQTKPLAEAEQVLTTLAEGWRECHARLQSEAAAGVLVPDGA